MYPDRLSEFVALKSDKITYKPLDIKANPATKDQLFQAINTIMGNIKHDLFVIYHGIRVDNLAFYLTAFAWQFNHRHDLK